MIGRLRGELVETDGSLVTIDVCGVGYEVQVPDSLLLMIGSPGEPITLLIRQIFREDGVSLYGFSEPFQRRLFDLLLGVKGCGPKVALALLGGVGADAVAGAIVSGDARTLTRASGVGARLAERIILELKDKMQEESLLRKARQSAAGSHVGDPTDELVDALVALGYRRGEALTAAQTARESSDLMPEQLKSALRALQK